MESMTTKQPIPMLDLQAEIEELWDDIDAAVRRVLRSGRFVLGPEVSAFEGEVASYLGVQHAIAVNSGTDALLIGLRAAGVGSGDEVITTPFTFFATVEAIVLAGATPVLVDIVEDGFNIDPAVIEAAVTPRTKAILPVHLFGEPVAIEPILQIASNHGLRVVEDAAQAFGAELGGNSGGGTQARAGSAGDIGAFSLYPSKNLGAYGDGGVITTNNVAFAERARSLRNHGNDPSARYVHRDVGYNSRLDEVQAAILRLKLPHVDAWNRARRNVARRYDQLFGGAPFVTIPKPSAGHVYHQYTVRVPAVARERVQNALRAERIASSVFYPPIADAWPADVFRATGALERAVTASATVLSLPMHPRLTAQEQERVVEVMRSVLAG